VLDAAWRALWTCLHPRVLLGSLLPLLIAGAAVGLGAYTYWEVAVSAVRVALERMALLAPALQWLQALGVPELRVMLAPLLVVALAVPVLVLLSLLLVALLLTPAIVRRVASKRFPTLERRQGAAWWQALGWSLGSTGLALLVLLASAPLWLVPPLMLVLPPLVWGWLSARVFAYDVLAAHATREERQLLMHRRRWPLLAMGVACGYLGALPSLLWALGGAAAMIFAPVLVLLAVWLYTLVFAYAAAWFAHYALAELAALRAGPPAGPIQLEPGSAA
jgi:hypothetical protein